MSRPAILRFFTGPMQAGEQKTICLTPTRPFRWSWIENPCHDLIDTCYAFQANPAVVVTALHFVSGLTVTMHGMTDGDDVGVVDLTPIFEPPIDYAAMEIKTAALHTVKSMLPFVHNVLPAIIRDSEEPMSFEAPTKAAVEKRPCIICGRLLGDGQSASKHALFCSGVDGCGGKAAASYKLADEALRHLCGLNLQDHSIKEQKATLELIRKMMTALKGEPK